jgi:hypothetical protein
MNTTRKMNPVVLTALLRHYNNPASQTYRSPLVGRVIAEQMKLRKEG